MKAFIQKILLTLLAVFLIIEEWLWDVLTVLGHYLFRFLYLARFELWLSKAPRFVALLAFLIPVIIATPMGLFAGWLLLRGHVLHAVVLELFAKLLGTFLVARVFALTRPQLLTFHWFARLYNAVMRWLGWAHERVAATAVYKAAKQIKAALKNIMQQNKVP